MASKAMTLAEALVLRKHLEQKVRQLEPLQVNGKNGLFELKTERKNISDTIDEVKLQVPKVTLDDVTDTYDRYSKALRQLDTSIQKANWATKVDFTLDAEIKV